MRHEVDLGLARQPLSSLLNRCDVSPRLAGAGEHPLRVASQRPEVLEELLRLRRQRHPMRESILRDLGGRPLLGVEVLFQTALGK